jgi:hypothetical protein
LAAESGIKVKSADRQVLKQCEGIVKQVEDGFNLGSLVEDALDTDESLLMAEAGFSECTKLLSGLGISNLAQVSQLREYVRAEHEKLRGLKKDFVHAIVNLESLEDLEKAIKSCLQDYRVECMTCLAAVAEKICEQMLRLSEIFIMAIAEEKLAEPDQSVDRAVDYAVKSRALALLLLKVSSFMRIISDDDYV